MSLLHIIATCDPKSGGPIQGVLLQEEITSKKQLIAHREIVSLDLDDAPFLKDVPIKVTALGERHEGKDPISRFLKHYGYSSKLVPWLRENASRFDVILVHGLWNYAPFGASRVLPDLGKPYFVFTHGMMDPWFKQKYPLKHLLKQCFWTFGEGKLLSAARSVLSTCEEEKLQARGVFKGHRYKETVVPYGTIAPPQQTDLQSARFNDKLPDIGSRPFLLYLSRIHEKKGADLLIEAYAKSSLRESDVDLVIAGPSHGDLADTLKAQAISLGVGGRIHWPGPIFGDEKWGALHGAEAFILPSHQENFGIAVAEALACGKPVLISNKVNIWREIEEDGAGIIADDTLEGTLSLLNKWHTSSASQKMKMSERAKACFAARFDVENTVPEMLRIITNLLETPASPGQ